MLLTNSNLVIYIISLLFVVGAGTFITGVVILALRGAGSEIRSLAAQTARLAQKGIAEDVAGLVGNASALIDSMNQMIRTARGVGMMLCFFGLGLMALASWLALQIYRM